MSTEDVRLELANLRREIERQRRTQEELFGSIQDLTEAVRSKQAELYDLIQTIQSIGAKKPNPYLERGLTGSG